MLFNSYAFLFLFLPLAFAGFHFGARIGPRCAGSWLAVASLVFYAWWNPPYVLLLLTSIAFNSSVGFAITRNEAYPARQTGLLIFGVGANLAGLIWFKYLASLVGFLRDHGIAAIPFEDLVLPLGISFFTFTQIGYLADMRQGVAEDRGPLNYLLFVTFFPHLIAGPILHHREMMPQFADPGTYRFRGRDLCVGLTIFVIGLCKKSLLADPLAPMVADGFAHPGSLGAAAAWQAVLAYSLQLYFDFSGYSDMAIGLARLFNIRFPLNFNSPYKAASIIDYWQRFHMTLTRYLTLYLFNPLALAASRRRMAHGREVSRRANATPGAFLSLVAYPTMVTMGLAGFWHGSGLQFLVFGLLHGMFITINHAWRMFGNARLLSEGKAVHAACVLLTYICACVAFVFFRAGSLGESVHMLAGMVGLRGLGLSWPETSLSAILQARTALWFVALYGIVWFLPNTQQIMVQAAPALGRIAPGPLVWLRWQPSLPWAMACGVAALAGLLSVGGTSEFLYFRF